MALVGIGSRCIMGESEEYSVFKYDDYGKPIYYGDTYYDIEGSILSESSVDEWLYNFRKEADRDDVPDMWSED